MPQSYQTPKSYQDLTSKNYQANQPYSYQKAHYPPKPVSTNQVPNGYERMSMQNQGQNWINQPVMQYHQGGCHLRNSMESDSRNILSLRKIIWSHSKSNASLKNWQGITNWKKKINLFNDEVSIILIFTISFHKLCPFYRKIIKIKFWHVKA